MYFDDMRLGMTVNVAPAVIDKRKMLEFAKEYDDVPLHGKSRTEYGYNESLQHFQE